jgi:hypothetical protein
MEEWAEECEVREVLEVLVWWVNILQMKREVFGKGKV